jgi:hypothetical protein
VTGFRYVNADHTVGRLSSWASCRAGVISDWNNLAH